MRPAAEPYGGTITVQPGSHSVVCAVLLSLLCICCAGQFYNRQFAKGLVLTLAAIVCGVITLGWSMLITWPLFLADAGCVAARLNRGEPVGQWQFF
jgi:hypothetical protein